MEQRPGNARLLTIAEIAKHFSLPESTARFYCKRFMDYLPHVGEGKRRRYRREVLDVFEVILDEMKKSKSASAVEEQLSYQFPRNIEQATARPQQLPQQQDSNPALTVDMVGGLGVILQAQHKALDSIAHALTALASREQNVADIREQLLDSQREVEVLRKEIRLLKDLQGESELVHQQDLEQLRKWLSRLAQQQSRLPGSDDDLLTNPDG